MEPVGGEDTVTLAVEELVMANEIAKAWCPEDRQRECRDFTLGKSNVQNTSVGIAAEMCVAKWLGMTWVRHGFFERKGGDVLSIEVRSTELLNGHLIVNDRDALDRAYVFVPRVSKTKWKVVGWYWGRDAVRPEWERTMKNGARVWYVPHYKLKPPEALKAMVLMNDRQLRSTAEEGETNGGMSGGPPRGGV